MDHQAIRIGLVIDAASALVKESSLQVMLQECAESMIRHLDAALARIWTLNGDEQILELQASAGLYTHRDGAHARVPVGTLKIGQIAKDRQAHLTNTLIGDPRVPDQEWARSEGLVAFAGYPLVVDDHLVGVAALFSRHPLDEESLLILASVADSLALGIEHRRAEDALRASLAREQEARQVAERQRQRAVTLAAERDRARAEAQAGRMRLESLFRQAPAAIAVIRGPEHVYELANPFYQRIVGKPERDLLGKPGREALPDLDTQGIWAIFDRIYATGEPFVGREFPVDFDRQGDGTSEHCYFNFVGQPAFDNNGAVDSILIHAVEVTEQVRARQQIEELAAEIETQRARLALGQRAGKIGTFDRNLESGLIVWTPDLEALYGYDPGELQNNGIDWITLVHPEDRAATRDSIARSIAEHRPIHAEFRVVRKDETIAHMVTEGTVEYDQDGAPLRVIGVNVDITDRKQVEINLAFLSDASKLLSSSLDYKTTLNTVACLAVPQIGDWCAVDMLDGEGGVQGVALAHRDPEKVAWAREVRQKTPVDMSAPRGIPGVLRSGKSELYPLVTDEMLVANARDEAELARSRSLGVTSVMIVPILARGVPAGTITFATTTSRKQYSETDLSMAEELASRASLAIENAQLYQEAQSALALRDEFISVASHELKTPVTSLKLHAQMLRRQARRRDDMTTADQLSKMENQIDRLTNLITNLLDVSKIQAGKLDYGSEVFNLEELVREIAETPQVAGENHTITVSGGTAMVAGDRDRIGQIVTNLLTNAIKYSPETGDVTVDISGQDETVTVAVRDRGIGIDPAFHDSIFDRFYQVRDPNDGTFPGLGMGLYISREIARRHGGDIRVDSVKGEGSTFYLVLPGAKAAPTDVVSTSH